jgi:eukaryotic-like serine/threonine-protein kinase
VYVPERTSDMAHRSNVSPDGKWALVVEMANGRWIPCRLVSIDGQSHRHVGPPDAGCTFAAWSPDGKWMYMSSSKGGSSHIWRQRFPEGEPEQLTFGPTEEDGIAIAPDGRAFITAVASRQSSVWVRAPAGDRQISLEGFAFDPQFTPDGKKLLYRILKGASLNEASELRVTDLESGVTEPLLPGITIAGTPSTTYDVSRDGRQAVVAGVDGQGKRRVWLVPVDRHSPPRAIPNTEEDADQSRQPQFVPSQPRFGAHEEVFVRMGPMRQIHAIREDGTGRKVSDTQGFRGLSPDDRWVVTLALVRDDASGIMGRAIVARSLAGEADMRLIAPTAPSSLTEMTLKWSPDGRTLFFVSAALDRGMHTKTYSFPLAPGKMFPSVPPGGFRSEAEMANTPGTRSYDVYDFAPGPTEGVYAFTRESVQRNLYRVPLR